MGHQDSDKKTRSATQHSTFCPPQKAAAASRTYTAQIMQAQARLRRRTTTNTKPNIVPNQTYKRGERQEKNSAHGAHRNETC